MYRIAVVLIVAAHLGFLGYVVVGGFLALRRPRTLWLHGVAVAWAPGCCADESCCAAGDTVDACGRW
ncbi:DUF2784 family protein [Mycolicibacter hiberniae]|nr:DUF2784 family protein [Mycolicibacter hiberniae]